MSDFLCDAHCHIDLDKQLLDLLIKYNIPATINCQSRKEWHDYSPLTKSHPFLNISFGIHPWDVDFQEIENNLDIFQQTPIIGEIGLDSVWTTNDILLQKKMFIKQLSLATDMKKPVILHTKGMEKEIADIISYFPNRYLVHWYSSQEHLKEYIKQDCYFTVGPSLLTDDAVKQVLTTVPKDRLLIESDGLDALAWALDEDIESVDYLDSQKNLMVQCAKILDMPLNEFRDLLQKNYLRWIN